MSNLQIVSGLSEFIDSNRIFRVIQPRHQGAGLFSYIWVCLQSIYENRNQKYYIDLTKWTPYYDPETMPYTHNVWDYYFEQPDSKTYPINNTIISVGCWNNNISAYCNLNNISDEKRNIYNSLIKKYIKPLPHIQEKINKFESTYKLKSKKILGVHIRGKTGKFGNDHPDLGNLYIEEISKIEKDYENIFVISDEFSCIEKIYKLFGDKVLYYKANRETVDNVKQVFLYSEENQLKNKYQSGEDVIIDAFLLSNSSFLICPYSNVSTFSHYLNLNMKYIDLDIKSGNFKKVL